MYGVHFARIKPSQSFQSFQSFGDVRIRGFVIGELIAILMFEEFIDE
jgi:hypothetical protein